jgi:prolyl 4-hydroxylase
MHHSSVSTNYPWLPHNVDPTLPVPDEYKNMPIQPLGNKQKLYEDYMQSCVDHYDKIRGKGERCWETERDRIAMALRQPKCMYNYTKTGFMKMKAPDHVFTLLKTFWDLNKHKKKPERWTTGNIYTNHWYVAANEGDSRRLHKRLALWIRTVIEEWRRSHSFQQISDTFVFVC